MKKNVGRRNKYIVLIGIVLIIIISIIVSKNENNSEIVNKEIFNNNVEGIKDKESDISQEVESIEKILDDPFFILVNKENLLSADYIPDDLQLSEIDFLDYIETRSLNVQASHAAKDMFDGALKDGIVLLGASGYRSYDVQVSLFNGRVAELGEEEARKYTAIPGASEHQTGLALDILGMDYQYLDDGFENSESFKWLVDNSYKYGFILRYLKGKEDITGYEYEPWHFRYIGNSEVAHDIMERNITLEEYINELQNELQVKKEKMQ